jgi:putative flippase GtrA
VPVEAKRSRAWPVERFHRVCVEAVARLPFGLDSVVAATFLGFVVINGCTFGIDLLLLTVLRGGLGLPLSIAVTVAYACAFALSYILNRILNFRSHAPIGPQIAVYVAVVVVNYLAFILGVCSLLSVLGVEYHLARILAGVCEAVYMYIAMRWVVFRRNRLPRNAYKRTSAKSNVLVPPGAPPQPTSNVESTEPVNITASHE